MQVVCNAFLYDVEYASRKCVIYHIPVSRSKVFSDTSRVSGENISSLGGTIVSSSHGLFKKVVPVINLLEIKVPLHTCN